MKKKFCVLLTIILAWNNLWAFDNHHEQNRNNEKVIVAYVTAASPIIPNPKYITHINYAFGHINKSFNGVIIANGNRLKKITLLKKKYPKLKVLLSIGGWGSGRFSEMAANSKYRKEFANNCKRIIKEFDLDGIDIDWEYPTSNDGGISSSPKDTENYTLLMRDLRKAIGKHKLLTLASSASGKYINFPTIIPYIDFINIMSYDMGVPPKHHSALYPSEKSGDMTCNTAVTNHLKAGVPSNKLVLGMPFYGRGGKYFPDFKEYKNMKYYKKGVRECWDDIAKVPYLVDKTGTLIFSFDNPRSLAIKCQYIIENNLLGGMFWEYNGDNEEGELRRTIYDKLILHPQESKKDF